MGTPREKLESFFINLDVQYQELEENMWLISQEENGLQAIIVYVEDELVTLRAKVMHVPSQDTESFFRELLTLNAEMVHGAYALDDDGVILIDTLELATMDLEEFRASLDSTGLALAQHYNRLAKYRKAT